jgi:hypothetical protein
MNTEQEVRVEVTVKGTIRVDKHLNLICLDLETDEGEYGCLTWNFDSEIEEDDFVKDLREMLDPPSLE